MSNISTVFDTIRTKVASILSSNIELPNSYDLIDNPSTILEQGWGIKLGPSTQDQGDFCNITTNRTISVVVTGIVFRTEGDVEPFITAAKDLAEKSNSLVIEMEKNDQLGIEQSLISIDFLTDLGLQFIYTDNKSFLYNEISFNVKISESRL
jgi:hypothetical protein